MAITRRVVLHFPPRLVEQPIVSRLVRDFNLDFNILKAYITPEEQGLMVLELSGDKSDFDRGVQYLTESGVRIQPLSQDVIRDETRCTSCGACVSICPTKAFELDPATREVLFRHEKCVACGICIKACPPRAMEVHF